MRLETWFVVSKQSFKIGNINGWPLKIWIFFQNIFPIYWLCFQSIFMFPINIQSICHSNWRKTLESKNSKWIAPTQIMWAGPTFLRAITGASVPKSYFKENITVFWYPEMTILLVLKHGYYVFLYWTNIFIYIIDIRRLHFMKRLSACLILLKSQNYFRI